MTQPNLHQKLATIRGSFGHIEKTGQNSGVGGGYKFVEAQVVARKFVEAASAVNVTMLPVGGRVIDHYKSISEKQHVIDLEMTWRITDGDSGECVDVVSYGQGADNSDKALPKAQTNAMKYAILLLLQVAGDDPEKDAKSNDTADSPAARRRARTSGVQVGETVTAAASAVVEAAAAIGDAVVGAIVEAAPMAEPPGTARRRARARATSPTESDATEAMRAAAVASAEAQIDETGPASPAFKRMLRAKQHEVGLDDDQMKMLGHFLTGKTSSTEWTAADGEKILAGLERSSTVENFRAMKVPAA